MKTCRRCLTEKPLSEFHKNKSTKDGYAAYCKPCKSGMDKDWILADPKRVERRARRTRLWQQSNPERYKESIDRWKANNPDRKYMLDKKSHLWTSYRLTIEDYICMLDKQDSKCAICRGEGRLYVDHDHACCPGNTTCGKCVRGLLCTRCNNFVGHIEIYGETINNAIAYIDYYKDAE